LTHPPVHVYVHDTRYRQTDGQINRQTDRQTAREN